MKYNEPTTREKEDQLLIEVEKGMSDVEKDSIKDLATSEEFKRFESIIEEGMIRAGIATMMAKGTDEEILKDLYFNKGKYGALLYIKRIIRSKYKAVKRKDKK